MPDAPRAQLDLAPPAVENRAPRGRVDCSALPNNAGGLSGEPLLPFEAMGRRRPRPNFFWPSALATANGHVCPIPRRSPAWKPLPKAFLIGA